MKQAHKFLYNNVQVGITMTLIKIGQLVRIENSKKRSYATNASNVRGIGVLNTWTAKRWTVCTTLLYHLYASMLELRR